MITWIIVFALALLSIVVFVFALRSQQDAEALEDRLAGTIDEEAAAHPHQAGGIEPLPEWIQPAARFGLKLAGNDKSRETTALLLAVRPAAHMCLCGESPLSARTGEGLATRQVGEGNDFDGGSR